MTLGTFVVRRRTIGPEVPGPPPGIVGGMRITRSIDGRHLPQSECRYCHREIVEVPEIGWLDPVPGDTYDLCPVSPYGDHEPNDARGDLSTSLDALL